MRIKFFATFFLLAVLLSGCSLSTMPDNALPSVQLAMPDAGGEAFTLDARFSLTLAAERSGGTPRQFSGRLFWQHEEDRDEWLFSDPLGQGIARLIRESDGGFTLEQGGKQEFIDDGQRALEARIGFPLPLAELVDWVRARIGSGALVERDSFGRIRRARESGWLLAYRYASDDDRLPSQLEAGLEEFRLKLAIERWDMK
jgi:outer membrane lipoprotein LolB